MIGDFGLAAIIKATLFGSPTRTPLAFCAVAFSYWLPELTKKPQWLFFHTEYNLYLFYILFVLCKYKLLFDIIYSIEFIRENIILKFKILKSIMIFNKKAY